MVNLFAILFFCVEKYVIAPHERANFIAFTERFVEKKVKLFSELEGLSQAADVKTKGRGGGGQTKKYDELIRNIRWLNHRITQAAFISSRGNILNSVRNSLFLWEEKQALWELSLNSKKIRGGRPDSISISDRLYTLKPLLLSGQNVYLALQWDFVESSLGFYVLVLLGVLSVLSLLVPLSPSFPWEEKKVARSFETGTKGFSDKPDAETRRITAETKLNTQEDLLSGFDEEFSYKEGTKNFILMDPTLEEYQKSTSIHFGESDPIQQIRQKAFDPETKELIEKVSSESPPEGDHAEPESDHAEQLERLQETFQEWGKSPQITLLNHIYEAKPRVKDSLEFLTSHLHYIARNFHADSLIFLSLNSEINCFEPLTFFGMPAEAAKNFYIHRKDPLFPIHMGQPTLVMIDEATKSNQYFTKKLNKRLASQMDWVVLLPLHFLNLDILLALFYKKDFSKEEMEEMMSSWKSRLAEISPIIKRVVFAHPKPENSPRAHLLMELKKMISLGIRPLNVLHVQTSYMISPNSFKKLSRAFEGLLKNNERFFYVSPKCLTAYLSSTPVNEFLSKTKPFMAGKLTHRVRTYPDEGEILDLYFE